MRPHHGYRFDLEAVQEVVAANSLELPGLELDGMPQTGSFILAGVDEAGRGPLAGPVVAAAVILPQDSIIHGLRDSKVVPLEQREALYCEIIETALDWSVSVVGPEIIDTINILAATLRAMREALHQLQNPPHLVLIDGNARPGSNFKERTVVKGDSLSASIMAASIIAKVTRDEIMREAHKIYPHYGFDGHKGYGCEEHLEAIRKFGPCPLHRMTFEPVRAHAQGRIPL